MSRKLTNPKAPAGAGPIVEQNIPRIRIEFGFVPGVDQADLDLAKTAITYDVADVDGTFTARHVKRHSVFHLDWTPELVDAVRTIAEFSETHVEGEGLMSAGISKTDI